MVDALLSAGVNVNELATLGYGLGTPLQHAVDGRRTAVALALLSHGADPSLERAPSPRTGLYMLHKYLALDEAHLSKE